MLVSMPAASDNTALSVGSSATRASRRAFAAGAVASVALTLALTAGALRPGYLLYRDFVTVPDPVLGANILGGDGAPRAVPLDLVTALATTVMPSWLFQKLLLVAPLLLAGMGAAWLVRRRGVAPAVAAATVAIWNPYVAERLLLGQAPTLLGYATIPWLVAAVIAKRSVQQRAWLILLCAAPAAITPAGGVMALVTVFVAAVFLARLGGDRGRGDRPGWSQIAAWCAPVVFLCLPWIVAGLRAPSRGAEPNGADAFAVAADAPGGLVTSVMTLGGVWAPGATPASRSHGWTLACGLLLVLISAATWWHLRRGGRSRRMRADVAGAAYLAPIFFALLVAGPALPWWRALQQIPGIALLRDTHRLLGFAAMALAVLTGAGVDLAARSMKPEPGTARRVMALGVGTSLCALAVLSVPDLAGRLHRDLRPVAFPGEWTKLVDTINAGSSDDSVLVLPWQPFRRTAWAGDQPFLDPLPRALRPAVLSAHDLVVRRGGREVQVSGEDARHGTDWRSGRLDAVVARSLGIRWVVQWQDSPGRKVGATAGLNLVIDGDHWRLWRVD